MKEGERVGGRNTVGKRRERVREGGREREEREGEEGGRGFGTYRKPALQTTKLLSAHVTALPHHPLRRLFDKGSGGHLWFRDVESFSL